MLSDELKHQILKELSFIPTDEQILAIDKFCDFIMSHDSDSIMILSGSAGTGKTFVASAIVKTMVKIKQKIMLLAPTGRAAKVFSLNSCHAAYTIHRRIYRQKTFAANMGNFNLNDNLYHDTLFIVDEASMIGNQGMPDSSFGSGCLLDDLIHFVYNGQNCRLMFVGDNAQLPPIGEDESPALSSDVLKSYGLCVYKSDLNKVLRQSKKSGILYNAITIRKMITHDNITLLPKIRFNGFADISVMPGSELIESLSGSYSEVGLDETMVITRSNKRANIYNQGIRGTVLGREELLSTGDMLMIVKNNYYWAEKEKADIAFFANGDRAQVQRVRNVRDLYGFHFADVWLCFPDYDNYELQATVLLDTLDSNSPSLTITQNQSLFNSIMEDYSDIPLKSDRIKKIKQDNYYNSLQIKYAYAVTCHKAQGGQWSHIYLDQGYMTDDMLTPDYIHWLYTAFTRAVDKLFLVNWPKTQTDENI